jgi:hypothetical protein
LLSNGFCEFFDYRRVMILFGVSPWWCLGRVQRRGTGNTHEKNWHWKVHDFDHMIYLVHF